LETKYSNLVMTLNGTAIGSGVSQQHSGPMSAYKNGIPQSVYDQISNDAKTRYPTDYEMQQSVIEWQVRSYKNLHGIE
jgi:hypothetical protein